MKYVVDLPGELPQTGSLAKAKQLNITKQLEEMVNDFCDNYCKWPSAYPEGEEDDLYTLHCDKCPFTQYL